MPHNLAIRGPHFACRVALSLSLSSSLSLSRVSRSPECSNPSCWIPFSQFVTYLTAILRDNTHAAASHCHFSSSPRLKRRRDDATRNKQLHLSIPTPLTHPTDVDADPPLSENDVQLPDEYDQINKDLLPFWAVKPKDLRKQIEEASFGPDTFTLRVKRGLLRTTHTYLPTDDPGIPERRDGQVELIKPIAKYLPDMTAVYTVHDTPHSLISWDFREDILEHIADGEYLDENDKVEATYHGWASACSWAAPINKAGGGGGGRRTGSRKGASKGANDAGTKEGQKSFIVDHAANMDICNHPEHVELHGLLAGKDVYVTGLGTTFAISKTTLHADVLGVPPERVVTPEFVPEIPWEEKVGDTLFWRGSTTGVDHRVDVPWRHTQRPRLTAMTANHTGVTTLLSPPGLMKSGASVADSAIVASNRDLSRKYTDVGFVSPVLQCSFDDGTCDNLKGEYPWLPRVTYETTDTHKYVIDVDGNAWSARFQRLLMSGSLVFKSTIIPEWWTDRIQPWVHYVPVKVDYSDLYDAFAFFAGDVDGRGGEDELARGVATAARQWSSTFFRDVDMTAYVFRLYLEWARLQAPHRGSGAADFVYDESMEALVE